MDIFTATVPLEDYIRDCRNAERFMDCCRKCPNYGRSWACPPFEQDIERMLGYESITLVSCKIPMPDEPMPSSEAPRLMRPSRILIESVLLGLERTFSGRAFTFAGTCLHCPEGTCSRLTGEPCRHPHLVRPSLEAMGFDVTATARITGVEILWGSDGMLPPYLTLVTALMHDSPASTVESHLREAVAE